MVSADNVEAVLTEIGFGRWQYRIMFITLISFVFEPVQQLGSTFMSAPVAFRCSYSYPEYMQLDNLTAIANHNDHEDHPKSVEVYYPSQCLPVLNVTGFKKPFHDASERGLGKTSSTGLPSCPEIEYDTSMFHSTVMTEYNLVCENSFLRPLYQMMFSVGSLLCSTFCGQLSDWIGRKRTFQMGAVLTLSAVLATGFVPWYSVVLIMRILSGTGSVVMLFLSYTIMSEISPINYRTITSLIPGLVYFIALPPFAGIAYLLPSWRKLLLLCNTPALILVPLTFAMDESPRWLLQTGRRKEAVALLRKAAKQNGVTLKPSTSAMLETFTQAPDGCAEVKRDYDMVNVENHDSQLKMLKACLFSPGMRIILIITPLMMMLKRNLHIGVLLNANNFTSTNPFEYMAISGVMGIVSIVVSIPISQRLGRRLVVGGSMFVGGALMLMDIPVPADYWWLKLVMVMTSFGIVCAAFQVTFVYCAELYPTVIRTRGFTFTNLAGAVGEMSIPFVTEIAVMYKWWAASVTFGLTGLIGGMLIPFLPETKGRPMPETLQDVEDRYWNDFKGKRCKDERSEDTSHEEAQVLQV